MDTLNRLKAELPKIIFAALASLLAVSESSIKSIVDAWLDDCQIIIEVRDVERCLDNKCVIPVQIFTIGQNFPNFRLLLNTDKDIALINKISFRNEYKTSNLALHPSAGDKCTESTLDDLFCKITKGGIHGAAIKLKELSSNYSYIFDIELEVIKKNYKLRSDDLSVYSQPEKEIPNRPRCKIETDSWHNYIARQGSLVKFVALCVIAIILIIVITATHKKKHNDTH